MEEYRKFIADLVARNDSRSFLNSDEDHAREVLVQLFQNAKSVVRIFAGSLCSSVPSSEEYVTALSDFIDRGGQIRVILNAFNEEQAKTSNLFKRLAYYSATGRPITIKRSTIKPYLANDREQKEVHFTVGDENSYRIETDIEKRTANCSFNNPTLSKIYVQFFEEIFKEADLVDLVDLFR